MTTMTEMPETTTSGSRWDDYLDVYAAPRDVFDRRRDAGWGHPFAVLVIASVALYYLLLPMNAAVMEAVMAQQAEGAAQPPANVVNVMKWVGGLFVPFNMAILLVIWAGILWGVARLADIAVTFRQGLVIAVYSAFVMIVQSIVSVGLVLLQKDDLDVPGDLSLGVLRFAGEEVPAVLAALIGRVDLFAIWMAVLWGVGLYVIGRTTKGRAALAAGIAWLLAALPAMLMALLQGAAQQG